MGLGEEAENTLCLFFLKKERKQNSFCKIQGSPVDLEAKAELRWCSRCLLCQYESLVRFPPA